MIKGKRTLKNGAVAGFVKQKDGSYKWRIISGPKKGGMKKNPTHMAPLANINSNNESNNNTKFRKILNENGRYKYFINGKQFKRYNSKGRFHPLPPELKYLKTENTRSNNINPNNVPIPNWLNNGNNNTNEAHEILPMNNLLNSPEYIYRKRLINEIVSKTGEQYSPNYLEKLNITSLQNLHKKSLVKKNRLNNIENTIKISLPGILKDTNNMKQNYGKSGYLTRLTKYLYTFKPHKTLDGKITIDNLLHLKENIDEYLKKGKMTKDEANFFIDSCIAQLYQYYYNSLLNNRKLQELIKQEGFLRRSPDLMTKENILDAIKIGNLKTGKSVKSDEIVKLIGNDGLLYASLLKELLKMMIEYNPGRHSIAQFITDGTDFDTKNLITVVNDKYKLGIDERELDNLYYKLILPLLELHKKDNNVPKKTMDLKGIARMLAPNLILITTNDIQKVLYDLNKLNEMFASLIRKHYKINNSQKNNVYNNSRNGANNTMSSKGGSQFIYIPNIGKRKVRYQKNGRAYVIVNKKKLKI